MTAEPRQRGPWRALRVPTALGAIAARAAGMGGAFAMSVAILRTLPKGDAGLVLLIYTLTTAAATLARFGVDTLALREVSRAPGESAGVIRHSGVLTLLASIPATALMVGAVVLQGRGTTAWPVVVAAGAGVLPAALSVVAGAVLRARNRVAAGTFAELGSPVLLAALGITVLGLTGRASLSLVVWAMTAGSLLTAVWSWTLVLRLPVATDHVRGGFTAFLRGHRASLLAFCTTALGFFLFSWMPVLAMGYFASSHTVGQYNVALYNAGARLAQFVAVVPMIQVSYLSHRFARLRHEHDVDAISRLSRTATRQAILVAAPIALIVCLLPSQVLSIFGDYSDAARTMQILAVGALLLAALGPVNALMLTCGHEKQAGRFTLYLLAASVVTLPLLARQGAAEVAAGGATISLLYAVACYVTLTRDGIHPALRPPAVRHRRKAP